jgi:hypothetical protein
MNGPVPWELVGILLAIETAIFGWIARELFALRQAREADREADEERRSRQASAHDNDLRDLWQALDMHRQESQRHAKDAGQFRETMIGAIGDIKAAIATLAAARPTHAHQQEHTQ